MTKTVLVIWDGNKQTAILSSVAVKWMKWHAFSTITRWWVINPKRLYSYSERIHWSVPVFMSCLQDLTGICCWWQTPSMSVSASGFLCNMSTGEGRDIWGGWEKLGNYSVCECIIEAKHSLLWWVSRDKRAGGGDFRMKCWGGLRT